MNIVIHMHVCNIFAAAINMKIELDVHTGDETYLRHIRRKLPEALDEFHPDIVVYNAGRPKE